MWFKVNDSIAMHPAVLEAGNAAMGLWVRAGAWSAQHHTFAFVPSVVADQFGTPAEAEALVNAGLWDEVGGGYHIRELPP